MRCIRNIQQQCMTPMIRCFSVLLIVLSISACTRMPVDYQQSYRSPVATATDNNKLDVVATAIIGSPTIYTDQITGLSTEITVKSEYFSANGRMCRRYTERQASIGSSNSRLGCNGDSGWVEIPVDSFAG